MNCDSNWKEPLGHERPGNVRKATLDIQKWSNELPQGEEPINRDGNPKHPPSQWIGEIEFQDYDELGFWEKLVYSNTTKPCLNDWYS